MRPAHPQIGPRTVARGSRVRWAGAMSHERARDEPPDATNDGAPKPLPWPPDVTERLTDYLAELRFNADMSQRQLSAASGVPLATLARIESGARPDPLLSTVARLV